MWCVLIDLLVILHMNYLDYLFCIVCNFSRRKEYESPVVVGSIWMSAFTMGILSPIWMCAFKCFISGQVVIGKYLVFSYFSFIIIYYLYYRKKEKYLRDLYNNTPFIRNMSIIGHAIIYVIATIVFPALGIILSEYLF